VLVRRHVELVGSDAWNNVVRPILDTTIERLIGGGAFEAARSVMVLDKELAGRDRTADHRRIDDMIASREFLVLAEEATTTKDKLGLLEESVRLARSSSEGRTIRARVAGDAAREATMDVQVLLKAGAVHLALDELEPARRDFGRRAGFAETAFASQQDL